MEVYKSIAAVQAKLAKEGIAKGRKNTQQNYAFRGIDDVYAALAPLLAEHELCIIPRIITRAEVERKTAKGGLALYVHVHAEFDFVSAKDGSKHTAATFGEAMDTADKATNKAMSAAYKYAAFMTFAIPTEGDNDADATTHEVAAREPQLPENVINLLAEIQAAPSEELPALFKEKGEAFQTTQYKAIVNDAFNKRKAA